MTAVEFIKHWRNNTLSERSGCQSHFLDLCELLRQPKPAHADPEGTWYTFERGARKSAGGNGWADVWKKDHFGWEYKKKHKDLNAAYDQLLQYREALENPPILVVCDMDRFEIHTNFTGTVKEKHVFDLEGLTDEKHLDILRKVFTDPDALKPGQTRETVTAKAAEHFGQMADGLRKRGIDSHQAAHFLMKLMFCMFAEDIGLLQNEVFSRILSQVSKSPVIGIPSSQSGVDLDKCLRDFFQKMSVGGWYGSEEILHFNGGLFADAQTIELQPGEVQKLRTIAYLDWSDVEPSIFGTLFERILDPDKRSQLGAHYTSREDIETLLQPVVMEPLRREWDAAKDQCEKITGDIFWLQADARKRKKIKELEKVLGEFGERLSRVTILDPACGSGNFLYVALRLLLDLEKEVITFAARLEIDVPPKVSPTKLAGIEINPYAKELASVVIWIGYLQWKIQNGYPVRDTPVLDPLESIVEKDAILDMRDLDNPIEPKWPPAEFIVGNPPFLGDKLMRSELGDSYTTALFRVYDERVPHQSDLCTYWIELARSQIAMSKTKRAGLLGTQGIRGGANRVIIERIKSTGGLFFAVSDREWILDGANVHISMLGFDDGSEASHLLDGQPVTAINANLTCGTDMTLARKLPTNRAQSFQGPVKVGKFELPDGEAQRVLLAPNPNGMPASDVVVPWRNGISITGRDERYWIIDFKERDIETASLYELPFQIVKERVKPERDRVRRERRKKLWWIHGEVNNAFRTALRGCARYVATCQTAKHRIFVWLDSVILPAQTVIAFPNTQDSLFGILHSRPHETWARSQATQLRERESGLRYTPTTCFETFPFPETSDFELEAIAEAALDLDRLRSNWLNPSEWTQTEILEFPGTVGGPWDRYIERGSGTMKQGDIGTVKYPRVGSKDPASEKLLKKRTLTNLYNERPTWLDLAHRRLDEAVFAAYGWDPDITDDVLLAKLLELNLERAAAE